MYILMCKMNKYVIVVLIFALFGCSGKKSGELHVSKIKNFKVACKSISHSYPGITSDTIVTYLNMKRIVQTDTVTYIYFNSDARLNDTLKIYGKIYLFNHERLTTFSTKKVHFKKAEIPVYRFLYDGYKIFNNNKRVMRASCSVPWSLFINDSLGLVLKGSRFEIIEYGAGVRDVQKQLEEGEYFGYL